MCRPTCAATIPPAQFKGMAADERGAARLAGEFGQTVQELVASQMKAGDQGRESYEASSGWRARA